MSTTLTLRTDLRPGDLGTIIAAGFVKVEEKPAGQWGVAVVEERYEHVL